MGGWQALLLQRSDIIVFSTISHYEPLVEAVAAPAGLHHQWVGDGSNVDSMGVAGYGTMARAQWRRHWHDGLVERWHGHNGVGTMAQSRWPWHRHSGTGAMAQPRAREQLHGHDVAGMIRRAQCPGTMASARWHGHGTCCDVYSRQIHALSAASPPNRSVG